MQKALGLLILALLALTGNPALAQDFPALTGRVVDQADLLDPAQEAALTAKLEGLETRTKRQLVVTTIQDLQGYDISDYGYRLGRHWAIGQDGKGEAEKDNGAILIVAPNERKMRIEVGYGLEPVLTDGFSSSVIRNDITPLFKAGDFPGGINAGVDKIITQIELPPEEAAKIAAQAASAQRDLEDDGELGMVLFWLFIFFFLILPIILSFARGGKKHRGKGSGPVIIWGGGGSSWGSSSSSWGSSSGSSFGGGGFSGGGGSFGGGGASGGVVTMKLRKISHVSEADHALVTAAVAEAEVKTSGEIVTIVTDLSDRYNDIALAWATAIAFLALSVVAVMPTFFLGKADWMTGGWEHDWTPGEYLALIFLFMGAKWLGSWLILKWMPLRLALVPKHVKQNRVRARAIDLFKVGTESKTVGSTGVLLYLSMREHRAEIVADQAIADKVAPEVWGDAMVALIAHVRAGRPGEGMAEAVRQMGVVLAEHFPKGSENPNELPDRLIEL